MAYTEDGAHDIKKTLNGSFSGQTKHTNSSGLWESFQFATSPRLLFTFNFTKDGRRQSREWQTELTERPVFFHFAQYNQHEPRDIKNFMINTGYKGEAINMWTFDPPDIEPPPKTTSSISPTPGADKDTSIWIWVAIAITVVVVVTAIIVLVTLMIKRKRNSKNRMPAKSPVRPVSEVKETISNYHDSTVNQSALQTKCRFRC